MAFGDQDAEIFFRDGSTAVLQNGSSFSCHFDLPEMVEGFQAIGAKVGEVTGRPTITYATADAPSLGNGMPVTVNGTRWTVRGAPRKQSDGLISVAELRA